MHTHSRCKLSQHRDDRLLRGLHDRNPTPRVVANLISPNPRHPIQSCYTEELINTLFMSPPTHSRLSATNSCQTTKYSMWVFRRLFSACAVDIRRWLKRKLGFRLLATRWRDIQTLKDRRTRITVVLQAVATVNLKKERKFYLISRW